MGILASNVVEQMTANEPFWILVSNFRNYLIRLLKDQVLAQTIPYTTEVVQSKVMLAEVLGSESSNHVSFPLSRKSLCK